MQMINQKQKELTTQNYLTIQSSSSYLRYYNQVYKNTVFTLRTTLLYSQAHLGNLKSTKLETMTKF